MERLPRAPSSTKWQSNVPPNGVYFSAAPSPSSRPPERLVSSYSRAVETRAEVAVSIILVSPSNQILLLRRVRTSTSFPSAHVFPGGNVSEDQDGKLPPEGDAERHRNGMAYRRAAIRECFEESGILLARRANAAGSGLLAVGDRERDAARKDIHANRIHFVDWVHSKGGSSDTGCSPRPHRFAPRTLMHPSRGSHTLHAFLHTGRRTAALQHADVSLLPSASWRDQ